MRGTGEDMVRISLSEIVNTVCGRPGMYGHVRCAMYGKG